jgi:hypothetical protein
MLHIADRPATSITDTGPETPCVMHTVAPHSRDHSIPPAVHHCLKLFCYTQGHPTGLHTGTLPACVYSGHTTTMAQLTR